MKKVFVSGCYDIIHAGHIQFFEEARALGDHLTVCFASAEVLYLAKRRVSALPDEHKRIIIGSLKCVDRVVTSSNLDPVFDFVGHWDHDLPDILVVTEDDSNAEKKRQLCLERKVKLVVLPKTKPKNYSGKQVSTTAILASIKKIAEVPLRVDFAGGWLDVPHLSKKDAFIVNCSITPKVSIAEWPYNKNVGLGGSAANAILKIKDGIRTEFDLGVGWQDPAVILETGLCVWRSGKSPVLESKYNPDWLNGKMLILWTGGGHVTPDILKIRRDYNLIKKASLYAKKAADEKSLQKMAEAVSISYKAQLAEGMAKLPLLSKALACKYLGGGHGGYALYLFADKKNRDKVAKTRSDVKIIEPYIEESIA